MARSQRPEAEASPAGKRSPAERAPAKAAKAGAKRRARPAVAGERDLAQRLVRIEETVAAQSERTEQVLARVTEARNRAAALRGPTNGEAAESFARALYLRTENAVAVDQPLALICQAQRSGGTLLARLFDGHPQIHAHPHELHIGDRRPHTWPALGLDETPDVWFKRLREEYASSFFSRGRRMIPLKVPGEKPEPSYYPFILPPAFQRALFMGEVERRRPIESEREILNCYMTSLFNGWLDNQNLHGPDKRWVVAFSPRRAWGEGLTKYFELYPDGKLISIIRDPLSWYTSAQGRDPAADIEVLLESWKRSATEMLAAARGYPRETVIVRFQDLILDTPTTMQRLADYLEIDFDPQLTVPTFNRYPVGANSSYGTTRTGVVTDPVDRYKKLLTEEQQTRIRNECEELYEEVLALTGGGPEAVESVVEPEPADAPVSD